MNLSLDLWNYFLPAFKFFSELFRHCNHVFQVLSEFFGIVIHSCFGSRKPQGSASYAENENNQNISVPTIIQSMIISWPSLLYLTGSSKACWRSLYILCCCQQRSFYSLYLYGDIISIHWETAVSHYLYHRVLLVYRLWGKLSAWHSR